MIPQIKVAKAALDRAPAVKSFLSKLFKFCLVMIATALVMFFAYKAGSDSKDREWKARKSKEENAVLQVHIKALEDGQKKLSEVNAQIAEVSERELRVKQELEELRNFYENKEVSDSCSGGADVVGLLNHSRGYDELPSAPERADEKDTKAGESETLEGELTYPELAEDSASIAIQYEKVRAQCNGLIEWLEDNYGGSKTHNFK